MQVFSERGCKYGTLETACPKADRKDVKMEGAKWMDIRSDRQKGLSYTESGRKYNVDPRTAKRYAETDTRPVYSLSDPKPSKLDPCREQLAVWLEEAPYSAERILEKIRCEMTDITELTPTLVNSLIERIEVHNNDKSSGHCYVKVDIYFTAAGMTDIPTEQKIFAMMEKIRKNPRDFRFVA